MYYYTVYSSQTHNVVSVCFFSYNVHHAHVLQISNNVCFCVPSECLTTQMSHASPSNRSTCSRDCGAQVWPNLRSCTPWTPWSDSTASTGTNSAGADRRTPTPPPPALHPPQITLAAPLWQLPPPLPQRRRRSSTVTYRHRPTTVMLHLLPPFYHRRCLWSPWSRMGGTLWRPHPMGNYHRTVARSTVRRQWGRTGWRGQRRTWI